MPNGNNDEIDFLNEWLNSQEAKDTIRQIAAGEVQSYNRQQPRQQQQQQYQEPQLPVYQQPSQQQQYYQPPQQPYGGYQQQQYGYQPPQPYGYQPPQQMYAAQQPPRYMGGYQQPPPNPAMQITDEVISWYPYLDRNVVYTIASWCMATYQDPRNVDWGNQYIVDDYYRRATGGYGNMGYRPMNVNYGYVDMPYKRSKKSSIGHTVKKAAKYGCYGAAIAVGVGGGIMLVKKLGEAIGGGDDKHSIKDIAKDII